MTAQINISNEEDIKWYKDIFDAYYESIRNYAWYKTGNVELADDIVQEVFLKLWQIRKNIEPSTIKALLYTIAQNIIKNYYKHLKVVYRFENLYVKENLNGNSADSKIRSDELQKQLENVLSQIPEGSREVLLMNRIDDMSYTEIANRLGISVKAVEKRMSVALRIIRKKFGYEI